MVIVDVFVRVRSERRRDESPYDHDYRTVLPLKELADRRGIAVVLIHHTNKRQDVDDPLDSVSSTTGFTGAADTIMVLAKGSQGPTLYGRGRDIEEIETALRFDHIRGLWSALGDATEVRRTNERKVILDALKVTGKVTGGDSTENAMKVTGNPMKVTGGDPMSPTEIADATGMKVGNVKRLLAKMVTAGEVLKVGRAKYLAP